MTTEVTFDPFQRGFADDPYPHYRELRRHGRAHRIAPEAVALSHHDDCVALLQTTATSVDDRNATIDLRGPRSDDVLGEDSARGRQGILGLDPPDHTRVRRLTAGAFTERRIQQLRPRVRALVAGMLDDLATTTDGDEPVDLMARFALPLSFAVIHEMLGLPDRGAHELRDQVRLITQLLEPQLDLDDQRAGAHAGEQMGARLRADIARKRRHPTDDLLSALLAVEDDGHRLATGEVVDQVRLLFLAGHETTAHLVGNGTLALLHHRGELERLVATPDLDGPAIDELVRYDSPVQLVRRVALTRLDLAGETVGAGDLVVLLIGSANRDETRWGATADRLDLRRAGSDDHLSFGTGLHACLGRSLARLVATEAVPALVRRFPGMATAHEPVRNGRIVLRGLDALPVALGRAVRPGGSG